MSINDITTNIQQRKEIRKLIALSFFTGMLFGIALGIGTPI